MSVSAVTGLCVEGTVPFTLEQILTAMLVGVVSQRIQNFLCILTSKYGLEIFSVLEWFD